MPGLPREKQLTLWTIETESRWRALERHGVITAVLPDSERVYPAYYRAYVWMADQLRLRAIDLDPESAPCWAWHSYRFVANKRKPDLRSSGLLPTGTPGVRIELSVPGEEAVLSQFLMWEYVLLGEYIALSRSELERIDRSRPTQSAIDRSWKRIFDLDAGEAELWQPCEERPIQACLARIELESVRRMDRFRAR